MTMTMTMTTVVTPPASPPTTKDIFTVFPDHTPKHTMASDTNLPLRIITRPRALSHQDYLNTLVRPTSAEARRIANIQIQKEEEIKRKYLQHTLQQQDAAKLIQRAYRGHRERRQLNGLTLDPSSRWVELIKEWRYRCATAPHYSTSTSPHVNLSRSPSDRAMVNWRRAKEIAEYAGAGESISPLTVTREHESTCASTSRRRRRRKSAKLEPEEPDSMLLDLRYFLEMVDQKHRYGSNLQVYHEQWQRNNTDQNFFYWLDYGDGRAEDLAMCPREKLEKECIRYLSKDERKNYLVRIDEDGLLRWDKNDQLITTSIEQYQDSMQGIVPKGTDAPSFNEEEVQRQMSLGAVSGIFKDALHHDRDDFPSSASTSSSEDSPDSPTSQNTAITSPSSTTTTHSSKKKPKIHVSPAAILNSLLRASVRPGTWIYVSDTVGRLYVGIKSSGAFQHASFLSGARISSAGIIGITDGKLSYLSPLSGHYRPTTRSFRHFMAALRRDGVDMSGVRVSRAYQVLLGMELYGSGKDGMKKVFAGGGAAAREERKRSWSSVSSGGSAKKNDLLRPVTLDVQYEEAGEGDDGGGGGIDAKDREKKGWGRLVRLRRKSAV